MINRYGLIGKKLSHSFSKNYFTEKFQKEGLNDCRYELFELQNIEEISRLVANIPGLRGLNVTIPYKEAIIPFLSQIDSKAGEIGAVNVVKIEKGNLTGYNSDFYGFRFSIVNWIKEIKGLNALVLGTGGASKAVIAALQDLGIPYQLVSRHRKEDLLTYNDLRTAPEIIKCHHLIINTTPLGMHPHVDSAPDINYDLVSSSHYLYDLVYNPEKTKFLQLGQSQGAAIKNGLEMLILQAEKSWDIWQTSH